MLWRVLAVAIQCADDRIAGSLDARVYRRALPSGYRMAQQPNLRLIGGQHLVGRGVGRAIVNHHDLEGDLRPMGSKDLRNLVDQRNDVAGFVVGRNHDAEHGEVSL